ncbi:MAG: LuxR family transcriptional regulator, partial [Nocardiopsaceae bacterium]|nr:LuxR family transcriptional regulator [Nocardiopsaceae bacterium]
MVTHGGRLPAETTRFFGRAAEAAEIRGALGHSRLVTLTGPGGVGKTRIAVRVAREQRAAFADGVCMVQLSGLRDADLLADTVAGALGLAVPAGQAPLAALVDYLRGKRMLIILDTCEHLIDACAMLADVVLRGADGPRLLATSRQALDIPGEVVHQVPPLAVPDDGGTAVALFADRAAAAVPGFTVTDRLLPDVVRLCRRLDGIPLAIELAAVRLRAVGLDELLGRLGDDRLRLLAGGSRRLPHRHQTLRMTIGWSYDLCSEAERLLWTRLSVFAGGFGLPAVEAVCADGQLGTRDIVDTLIGLVDKSIVLRTDATDATDGARYRMLDMMREYGAERLADAGSYRGRHLAYYRGLARSFESGFLGPEQATWFGRLARDYDNILLALEYCASPDVPPERVLAGLDIATSCWGFWMATGRVGEASRWLERLLDGAPEPSPQRARGLWLASWFLSARGENAESSRLRAQAREIAARLGEQSPLLGSMEPLAAVLRGLRAVLRGEHEQAVAACDEVLSGLPREEKWVRGTALWVKGLARWFTRDLEDFARCQREGIVLRSGFGDLASVALHLECFAWLAASQAVGVAGAEAASGTGTPGGFVRTARLLGATDQMRRRSPGEPRYGLQALYAERVRAEQLAREALGAGRYADEHAAGAAMVTGDAAMAAAEAVRYALGA